MSGISTLSSMSNEVGAERVSCTDALPSAPPLSHESDIVLAKSWLVR